MSETLPEALPSGNRDHSSLHFAQEGDRLPPELPKTPRILRGLARAAAARRESGEFMNRVLDKYGNEMPKILPGEYRSEGAVHFIEEAARSNETIGHEEAVEAGHVLADIIGQLFIGEKTYEPKEGWPRSERFLRRALLQGDGSQVHLSITASSQGWGGSLLVRAVDQNGRWNGEYREYRAYNPSDELILRSAGPNDVASNRGIPESRFKKRPVGLEEVNLLKSLIERSDLRYARENGKVGGIVKPHQAPRAVTSERVLSAPLSDMKIITPKYEDDVDVYESSDL